MNARLGFDQPSAKPRSDRRGVVGLVRSKFVGWLLADLHLGDVKFGEHSVTIGDKITMDTQAVTAMGQIGMDATTGRIRVFVGGAQRDVAAAHEVMKADGSVVPTADQSFNNRKITSLANGTATGDAVNKGQLDAAVSGLKWVAPVSVKEYIGTRTIAQINALTPASGDSVVAGDAGTPSAGGSDALAAGDIAEYNGTAWKKIVANSGGFPPAGTRALVSGGALYAPLTDATDENKIAEFGGASLTPTLTLPLDGNAALVIGELSVNENKGFTYDASGVVGWTQFSGTGLDHGAQSGLADDDHTQYALLAGRNGGQTFKGGALASDNLVLQSTNHGTKGDVRLSAGDTFKMMGDDTFIPATTGQGKLGTTGNKFAEVRALNVYTGDLHLENPDGDPAKRWKMVERADGITVVHVATGQEFDLGLRKRGLLSRILGR